MSVNVLGRGKLAELLRDGVHSDTRSAVIVVAVDGDQSISSIAQLTDAQIDEIYEQPMQRVIAALQEAHTTNCERIVVVVPTTGMSGGACYAPQAALAESARILVKSAARQWGASGITVNAVAVEPHWFSINSNISGPVAIAPRSLSNEVSPVGIVTWLCSEAARDITGQTIVCDGGLWM
jgi:NAD(P)-dependent dehydrogenase (short-subunit alcohol dehydrogenase family)